MARGQAQLKARAPRAPARSALAERGGYVAHPLLADRALAARPFQVAMAQGALSASTLVVLPTGLGKTAVAVMVAAERLRQAGGFVLVLAPTRPLARQLAAAFVEALAPSAATKVALVTGSTVRGARAAAFREAWVVVSTPETVEAELAGDRLDLARCSLMVVDEAHRAVGAYAYVEVARALRRDRPGGLVLALTASPGSDRRRIAAMMDALGLQRVDARTRDDADVAPYLQPLDVEVVEVELDPATLQVRALLEAELAPAAERLARLGVLPPTPARLLSKREVLAAGDALRRRHQRNRAVYFEGLKAHAEAMLLVHALELIETQGARPLADFLGRLGEGPDASRAERALAARPGVRDALLLARGLSPQSHPKVERLIAILGDLLREHPGARSIVFTQYRDSARALCNALSRGPPLGPGLACALILGRGKDAGGERFSEEQQRRGAADLATGESRVLIATSVAEEGLHPPAVDLVVFFEAVPSEIRAIQRRGRAGRTARGRVVVLVAKDTRDGAALIAAESREKRMHAAVRWLKEGADASWQPPRVNRPLPLESAQAGGEPARGAGGPP